MKVVIIAAASLTGDNIANVLSRELGCQLVLISSEQGKTGFLPNANWIYIESWNKKNVKKTILEEKPDAIVNCYSYDNIDDCEENKSTAWDINVEFHAAMVSAAKICEAHYITFSSEMLFDDTKGPYCETDLVNALSYYGKSMLARENSCSVELSAYTIFRTTEMFGTSSYEKMDLISKYQLLLETGIDIEVDANYYSNPVFVAEVANAVAIALERKKFGVYHLAGAGYSSKYEIVKTIAKVYNYDESLVIEAGNPNVRKRGLIALKAETDLRMKFSTFENAVAAIKYNAEGTQGLKYL